MFLKQALLVFSAIFLFQLYSNFHDLPAQVHTRFDFTGTPKDSMNKSMFTGLSAGTILFVTAVFYFLTKKNLVI